MKHHDLIISITYTPRKAATLTSDERIAREFKSDLTLLGFSHPRQENIYKDNNVVKGYWPDLNPNHTLFKLAQGVNDRVTDEAKKSLAIDNIVLSNVLSNARARHRQYKTTYPTYRRDSIPTRARSASPPRSLPAEQNNSLPGHPTGGPIGKVTAKYDLGSMSAPRKVLGNEQSEGASQASSPIAPQSPDASPPPIPTDSVPPLDIPKGSTSQLTRDFWNIKRELTATRARLTGQLAILLDELERRGAPGLPSMQAVKGELDAHAITTLEARLREETELRKLTETRLQLERRRREDAERALQDVQRECKEPFIVPALMKAFLDISQLSEEAITKPI